MANHCIDIICLGCGAEWCGRGCSQYSPADADNLKAFHEGRRQWEAKYGPRKNVEINDESCPCGGQVVIR